MSKISCGIIRTAVDCHQKLNDRIAHDHCRYLDRSERHEDDKEFFVGGHHCGGNGDGTGTGGNGGGGSSVTCWDGSTAASQDACPASKTCSDKTVVAEDALCLYPNNEPSIGIGFHFSNAGVSPVIYSVKMSGNRLTFEEWMQENNNPTLFISGVITYKDGTQQTIGGPNYVATYHTSEKSATEDINNPVEYYRQQYGPYGIYEDYLNVCEWDTITISIRVGKTIIPFTFGIRASAYHWGGSGDTEYDAEFVVSVDKQW